MLLIAELLMYFLLLLTLLYCWFRYSHRDLLRTAAGLPVSINTWPIFGHLYSAFGGRDGITRKFLESSLAALARGMKTCCFWCGPLPLIVVHDMEDIKTILNSSHTSDKGDEYQYFLAGTEFEDQRLIYSLLSAPGNVWRHRRKHINPVFHPRNLDHMIPVYNRNSRELVSCLSKHVDQGPVNLLPHTMDTALKTVCNLLFGPGVDVDPTSSEFRDLMAAVESSPELFIARIFRPWLRIESVFRFMYRNELKKLTTGWKNFTNSRLEKAKAIGKLKNLQSATTIDIQQDGEKSDESVPEPLTIVDAFSTLQKYDPEYTEEVLHYDIYMFFCTGTDTLGSATASCLLALATYPEIQERLYQEVCSVVGPDEDVSLEDLNRMPYLDQVLKETLRWFLTVPYVLRKATKDVKLSTCNIPAGSSVIIALMGIHMDPKIYSDPLKFNPDRFSDDNPNGKERFTYIPFSGGPRNCIAKTYSMQLMKIMLVYVLQEYRLRTDMDIHKLNKRLVVTLISADGYNVYLEKREKLTR